MLQDPKLILIFVENLKDQAFMEYEHFNKLAGSREPKDQEDLLLFSGFAAKASGKVEVFSQVGRKSGNVTHGLQRKVVRQQRAYPGQHNQPKPV
jgi:hypothetical protein